MEAVIFIGIQAVGKSSFFQARLFRTHIRLNLDMLRTRHREDILFYACLEAKQPFVIDNTNPTAAERARYIQPARAAHFRVIGYFFESTLADALRRNAERPAPEQVPEVGIRAAYNKLEPPTLAEGFDRLYRVKIDEVESFLVQEWAD
jgi:predicted kinase